MLCCVVLWYVVLCYFMIGCVMCSLVRWERFVVLSGLGGGVWVGVAGRERGMPRILISRDPTKLLHTHASQLLWGKPQRNIASTVPISVIMWTYLLCRSLALNSMKPSSGHPTMSMSAY